MQKKFPKDLEDMEVYINIKSSMIHKVACRFLVMPCVEAIEWILLHMASKNLVLSSESKNDIATYHPRDINYYYKMVRPREYTNTQLYATWKNLNTKDIIKSWCQEPAKSH